MAKKLKESKIEIGESGYPRMSEMFVPKAIFFTNGVGVHKDRLSSFELALRIAGIEKANLVTVSSIFPPRCREISRKEGQKYIMPGQIVHCVMPGVLKRGKVRRPFDLQNLRGIVRMDLIPLSGKPLKDI